MKKLYLCQVVISDDEPMFVFMIKAENRKECMEMADEFAESNYPIQRYDSYREDMCISEIKSLKDIEKVLLELEEENELEECSVCGGTGNVDEAVGFELDCKICGGTGYIKNNNN